MKKNRGMAAWCEDVISSTPQKMGSQVNFHIKKWLKPNTDSLFQAQRTTDS